MQSFDEIELNLPELPSEDEWRKHINGLTGIERDLGIIRAKGYNLLGDFDEPKASFERIAWLNFWSKTMTALESATSAYQYGSDWVLQTISRSTFEWRLHVLVIFEPLYDVVKLEKTSAKIVVLDKTHENAQRKIVERLRGYAAWCLWNDKKYFQECLHPKTLDAAWDPSPAKEILSDEEELEKYEYFFGKLEAETDSEKLKQGREHQERILKGKIARIEQWLEDPKLKQWHQRIIEIARKKKGNASFFNLFDPNASIAKSLYKHGMRFTYNQYSLGSMGIHGSTMFQFVNIGESSITPKYQIGKDGDEDTFSLIMSDCNWLIVMLAAMNKFVLENEKIRF